MTAKQHRIAIAGITGRMGRAVSRLAGEHHCTVVGGLAAPGEDGKVVDGTRVTIDPAAAIENAEVVVDFSHPSALAALADACAARAIPLVTGTTNFGDDAARAIERLSRVAAVLAAPNMSLGVQVLAEIVEMTARRLGLSFDVEIVEAHHGLKIDAPSGTAKRLYEAVENAIDGNGVAVHGREGNVGARKRGEIGIHAIRGGDVVGDHTVLFLGHGERLELTHRASSRDLFAHGALRAARFLIGRHPGRFHIRDLLGA